MEKITTTELYELFIDTLRHCTTDVLLKSDEDVEYDVLEEALVGAQSFLHQTCLERLVAEEFIDDHICKMSLSLREKILAVCDKKYNAHNIRNDDEWRQILQMSDQIVALVRQHEQVKLAH